MLTNSASPGAAAARVVRIGGARASRFARRRSLAAIGAVLVLALSGAASVAHAADGFPFEVTVVYVSPEPGGVEASKRAKRIDALLGKQVRYQSLRILKHQKKSVRAGEIASVELPTGQRFRFRPMDATARNVLVAVDMDDSAQGDFRVPKGKPIVLGGQPYQDGQLVIVLEYVE